VSCSRGLLLSGRCSNAGTLVGSNRLSLCRVPSRSSHAEAMGTLNWTEMQLTASEHWTAGAFPDHLQRDMKQTPTHTTRFPDVRERQLQSACRSDGRRFDSSFKMRCNANRGGGKNYGWNNTLPTETLQIIVCDRLYGPLYFFSDIFCTNTHRITSPLQTKLEQNAWSGKRSTRKRWYYLNEQLSTSRDIKQWRSAV